MGRGPGPAIQGEEIPEPASLRVAERDEARTGTTRAQRVGVSMALATEQ